MAHKFISSSPTGDCSQRLGTRTSGYYRCGASLDAPIHTAWEEREAERHANTQEEADWADPIMREIKIEDIVRKVLREEGLIKD